MDAFPFIKEMLSVPALRVFLSDNGPVEVDFLNFNVYEINEVALTELNDNETEHHQVALIKFVRLYSHTVGIFMRQSRRSRRQSRRSRGKVYGKYWKKMVNIFIAGIAGKPGYLKRTEAEGELEHKYIDAVMNSLDEIKKIEDLLPDKADSSNFLTNKEMSRALLIMTAFPALRDLKDSSKILAFLLELSTELDNLPELICEACEEQPLSLLLMGTLLSLKPRAYDTWNEVKDDLVKIKEADNSDSDHDSDNGSTNDPTWHIIAYCFYDLPLSLRSCFLYVACYPIDYEIPARSLTEIWIAEKFVKPEEGETIEETAYKYLEQLVQRSLVWFVFQRDHS